MTTPGHLSLGGAKVSGSAGAGTIAEDIVTVRSLQPRRGRSATVAGDKEATRLQSYVRRLEALTCRAGLDVLGVTITYAERRCGHPAGFDACSPDLVRRAFSFSTASHGKACGTVDVRGTVSAQAAAHLQQALERTVLEVEMDESLVGNSPAMLRLKGQIRRVAACDSTVLVRGESGTGKESVARLIHLLGPRSRGPFVRFNCGALTETLLEKELFGAVKGAYTGATANQKGLFVAADRGTIFLDEFGDMTPAMQSKLLRVLQERVVRPVGATDEREIKIDVRVIVATNKDLPREVAEGRFRADLYYRVNVVSVTTPALRDRLSDIPVLCERLLPRVGERARLVAPARLDPKAWAVLQSYSWPGNVRELEHFLECLSVMDGCGGGRVIKADAVRAAFGGAYACLDGLPGKEIPSPDAKNVRAASARQRLADFTALLNETGGNFSEAARRVGLKRTTFYQRYNRLRVRLANQAD